MSQMPSGDSCFKKERFPRTRFFGAKRGNRQPRCLARKKRVRLVRNPTIHLEADVGAAERNRGQAGRPGPGKRIEYDNVRPTPPERLDAPPGEFDGESREMRVTLRGIVGKLPHGADRRCDPKIVVLLLCKQVDPFMRAVRTATTPLRHWVTLLPDHFAPEQEAAIAELDNEAEGQSQEIAVAKPSRSRVEKRSPAMPGFGVGRVARVQPASPRPERTVLVVVEPPVDRRVVGVSEVDPHQARGLERPGQRLESLGQRPNIIAGVILDANPVRGPLAPVRRAGHDDVDGLVRELRGEVEAIAARDAVGCERPDEGVGSRSTFRHLGSPSPPSRPHDSSTARTAH